MESVIEFHCTKGLQTASLINISNRAAKKPTGMFEALMQVVGAN
jgi:hypothetical protein